jgi:hypothetical protein|tara:strand:- start:605 stop:1612 length:1008 start_codon:yes stop_codon:yes gene_type:complete
MMDACGTTLVGTSKHPTSTNTFGFSTYNLENPRNQRGHFINAGHTRPIRGMKIRTDHNHGGFISTCANDGGLHITSLRDESVVMKFKLPKAMGSGWCVDWNPSNEYSLVVGTNRGSLHVYDIRKPSNSGTVQSCEMVPGQKKPVIHVRAMNEQVVLAANLTSFGQVNWRNPTNGGGSVFIPWTSKDVTHVKNVSFDDDGVVVSALATGANGGGGSRSKFMAFNDVNEKIQSSSSSGSMPVAASSSFYASVNDLAKRPGMTSSLLHAAPFPLVAVINGMNQLSTICADGGHSVVLPLMRQSKATVVATMSWKYDDRSFVAISKQDGRVDLLSASTT